MPVLAHIVEQHAEEAAFLWLLRDAAVSEPHYTLKDLAELEERLEAHIDGLRIAGDEGWAIGAEQLSFEEVGEVFAAGCLAFGADNMERIRQILDVVRAEPECARGLVSALGWMPYDQVAARIGQLCQSREPLLQRVGIAASTAHRRDPGPVLTTALESEDAPLRARSLRAVGELGRVDLLPVLRESLRTEDATCRTWAAWSAALLGEAGAVDVLQEAATLNGPAAQTALNVAVRRMNLTDALAWREHLAADTQTLRSSVIAAGAIGDPVVMPWLFDQMSVPKIARVAGEAFTMITGIDLSFEDLDQDAPPGFEASPTDDVDDDNVAPDPDEDLAWPDPELISKRWQAIKSQFRDGTRYLVGQPIGEKHLSTVLLSGYQHQRIAAALEQAIGKPGVPLFEVSAPAARQRELLSQL